MIAPNMKAMTVLSACFRRIVVLQHRVHVIVSHVGVDPTLFIGLPLKHEHVFIIHVEPEHSEDTIDDTSVIVIVRMHDDTTH